MSPICDVTQSEASEVIQILPLDPLAKSEKKKYQIQSYLWTQKRVGKKKLILTKEF